MKQANVVKIATMKETDFKFAVEMTDNEKWEYLKSDFEKLLAYEPDGCFVARVNNQRAGIITSTSYNDYAFVGSLIVKDSFRNKKIGERLLVHALEYLQNNGVKTIELDGVFKAVSLYRRLGFKDKYLSLRFFRPSDKVSGTSEILTPEATEEIITFDHLNTRLERSRILKRYLQEYRESVYMIKDSALSAYAFVRPRAGDLMTIGPIVATTKNSARKLIIKLISKYSNNRLSIGVPEHNRTMVQLLYKLGFNYNPPSLRMYLGKKRNYEKNIYGILSPEKG